MAANGLSRSATIMRGHFGGIGHRLEAPELNRLPAGSAANTALPR